MQHKEHTVNLDFLNSDSSKYRFISNKYSMGLFPILIHISAPFNPNIWARLFKTNDVVS